MAYYVLKTLFSAAVITLISEIAKRHSGFAALLAALPLTTLLAFVWLHLDATPPERIADLANQIFWLVIPSLVLFLTLPALLRHGWNFWASLGLAMAATSATYLALLPVLRRFGVNL
jgi:hypothetical protein